MEQAAWGTEYTTSAPRILATRDLIPSAPMTRSAVTSIPFRSAPAILAPRTPTFGAPEQVDYGQAMNDLGPSRPRRLDQDGIQDGPSRSNKGPDAIPLLNGNLDRLVASVVEARFSDRWGPRRTHLVEQPPAVQLEHCAPHQSVGRESVTPGPGRIDRQDAQPPTGEEHGCRSSGTTRPRNDHVIVTSCNGHGDLTVGEIGRPRAKCESLVATTSEGHFELPTTVEPPYCGPSASRRPWVTVPSSVYVDSRRER